MAVPIAPTPVVVSELKSTSVKVSATHSQSSGLTAWFFYVVPSGGTARFIDATYVAVVGGDTVFSVVITGLTPNVNHAIFAGVFNADGQGPYSLQRNFTTYTNYLAQPAPNAPTFDIISHNNIVVEYTENNTNRPPVLERRIGYGTSPTAPTNYISAWTLTAVVPLLSGTTYYFWAQNRNEVGWSALSPPSEATTLYTVSVKWNNTWKVAIPWVKVNGVWKTAKPWSRIMGIWKGVK